MGPVCFPVILKSWAGQCEKLLPKKKTHEVIFCAFFVGTSRASTWFICFPFVHSISYLGILNCLPSWFVMIMMKLICYPWRVRAFNKWRNNSFSIPGSGCRHLSCRISFAPIGSHLVCIISRSFLLQCGYRFSRPSGEGTLHIKLTNCS